MKRFLYLGLATLIALALSGCTPAVDPLSSTADMTGIALRQALNPQLDQDYSGVQNPITKSFMFETLPGGVDVSHLVPSFTLSAGASARIGAVAQTSGVSVVDFTNDVTYTVTAEDGSTKKNFTVHVEAPSLGFTSFSIAVPGMGDMPLTVDNDELTITGEIPYTYRTAIDSELIVSFVHNGTGVWFTDAPSTELLTGVAPLDFSAATGKPSWSIDLRNGTEISKTYTVTVTAAATASADADLASFSVVSDTVTYNGVIAGTTVTLPLLPPSANLAALTANFAMSHVGAVLKDSATMLESGTSTVDLSTDRTLTGVAEDGTTKDYTIVKPVNTPALAIVAFDSADDSDNLKWIEVKVLDKARVSGVARLVATGQYENVLIPDFTALPYWGAVANGDVIRVWDAYALKTSDVNKSDNSPAVWDQINQEVGKYNLGEVYGALFVDIGGTPVNLVAYSVGTNSSWTVKTSMTTAVNAKLWPSTLIGDAYKPIAYTAGCFYQLKSGVTHGISAADWERATGQEFWTLGGAAASRQVNAGTGGDVTFSVTPTYTGAGTHSMTSVRLDVSALLGQASDTTNLDMADPEPDGTWTVDYTVPTTVTSGTKSLRFRTETVVDGVTLLDTATTLAYIVLGPKDFTLTSASVDQTLILASVATTVNFSATVTPVNIDAVDSVTADLSALGGTASEAFADPDQNDVWTLAYEIPATVAAGTYPVTVTATVFGENGTADIVKTNSSISITVSSDPVLNIDSASVTPTLALIGAATPLSVSVATSGINGAAADSVTVDYRAFDGGSVVAMTDSGAGNWTDASFTVPDTQTKGTYTIVVTATDSAHTLEKTTNLTVRVVLPPAFTNSDLEADAHATIASAFVSYVDTIGPFGTPSRALRINGTTTASTTLWLSSSNFNPLGAYTKVSFWVKGKFGDLKYLDFAMTSTTSPAAYQVFLLGSLGTTPVELMAKTTASFLYTGATGTVNTELTPGAGDYQWVKVTLNLGVGTATPTNLVNPFMIRCGTGTIFTDFYIDEIHYE